MNDRGQIVIPEDIRETLSLGRNSTLVLVREGKRLMLVSEKEFLNEMSLQKEFAAMDKLSDEAFANFEDSL